MIKPGPMGPVFDMFDVGEFRAPARPTFVNSDKSRQKHRKEPPVPSPPGALYSVRTCDCIPHVHEGFSFCLVKRIVSAPAPLPLNGTEKDVVRLSCGGV